MISKSEMKAIKRLKLKKYRIKDELFVVEGVKNIKELLTSRFELVSLYCLPELSTNFSDTKYTEANEDQLQAITSFATQQGCLAVAKISNVKVQDYTALDHHLILLDGVSDPGNLGTIIRTLDWFGYSQLICSSDCADCYNPKTISATMGSFTRVNVVYVDLISLIQKFKGDVYGMSLNGQSLNSLTPSGHSAFVLGSESHGIRPELLGYITNQITIAKHGQAESLNVGIAAGILLHRLSLS
jgi:TrmH family RNA methyltransferase